MQEFLGILFYGTIILIIYYLIKLRKKSSYEINSKGNKIDKTLKNSVNLVNSNITKIKKKAQISISKSYITGCSWLLLNNKKEDKNIVYTFRTNNELLITKNGIVERLKFELIVDSNSILVTKKENITHYNIINIQDDFLFLKKLSDNKILIFANLTKYKDQLKSDLKEISKQYY